MGHLFQEIQRRKVFRVAAVYAVVAWLIIQVAGEVLPTFNAPAWVNQTLIVILILGLPITLVVAWAFDLTPDGIRAANSVDAAVPISPGKVPIFTNVMIGMVLLAVGFLVVDQYLLDAGNPAGSFAGSDSSFSRRFRIDIGETVVRGGPGTRASIGLSPDGNRLVYGLVRPDGEDLSYLLELGQLEPRELPGVTVSGLVGFSPDSEWIIYSDEGLHKVSVRGGASQQLTDSARDGQGLTWAVNDSVFYIGEVDEDFRLMQISANGGLATAMEVEGVPLADGYYQPHLLPDGDSLLYTYSPGARGARDGQIVLLSLSSGETRTLIQEAYNVRYAPTGHLVFVRAATLWAVPFDLRRLEVTGAEVPLIQGVETEGGRGRTQYDFSNDGLLVYLPGGDTTVDQSDSRFLAWADAEGNEERLPLTRDFRVPTVSPDQQRIAVVITEDGNDDIWTYDLARNVINRLSFDSASDYYPLWTPDGERIVFQSQRDGGGLWWRAADGTGRAEALLTGARTAIPYAFTPDGSQLVYESLEDLYILDMDASPEPRPLIQTEFFEGRAAISPDGRWIAYESDESGQVEIYVRPFPEVDSGKWQVSSRGGSWPKWHPDGQRLFFRDGGGVNNLWSASVETENVFSVGLVENIIANIPYRGTGSRGGFDISNDGSRFLFVGDVVRTSEVPEFSARTTQLVVVENWFEELVRLAPPDAP